MSEPSRGGVGFCGLLTVFFVGLKLTHYIDWSWWLVLGPLWLPMTALFLVVFVVELISVSRS